MLSCTGKRSHRHTILHVSFSNSFGLASARPTPQGLSGAPVISPNGKSIKEIADILNFPNASAFGTFFKKQVGMSPINYRQKGG